MASVPPACLNASFTASIMAFELTVAPVTVSTLVLLDSFITKPIVSIALSPKPFVSECSTTLTSLIFPSTTVTSTFTSPLFPFAFPTYVPAV